MGGEGKAPVPTPRFAGARHWKTDYQAPALEDLKPYADENGKIWLIHKTTGQAGWVYTSVKGYTIESTNAQILQLSVNASFINWTA